MLAYESNARADRFYSNTFVPPAAIASSYVSGPADELGAADAAAAGDDDEDASCGLADDDGAENDEKYRFIS